MHKTFLKTAALLGAFSVGMGAFAAHALKDLVSEYAIGIFETAVRYQFYHVFALLAVGILYERFGGAMLKWAGRMFIIGTILFSGSLYALAVVKGAVLPGFKWLGPITPLGGLCFILGWIFLFIALLKKQPDS